MCCRAKQVKEHDGITIIVKNVCLNTATGNSMESVRGIIQGNGPEVKILIFCNPTPHPL